MVRHRCLTRAFGPFGDKKSGYHPKILKTSSDSFMIGTMYPRGGMRDERW